MSQNKIIVITGDIACGKTTVCKILEKKHYTVISTDQITHELYQKDQVLYRQIIQQFSENILDDEKNIDRQKLGKLVFHDSNKRKRLEQITHAVIIDRVKDIIDHIKNPLKPVIFIEIPLYDRVEALLKDKMNIYQVWFITSNREIQQHRLMKDRNFTLEEALMRIDAQKQIRRSNDIIIANNGSYNELEETIKNLLEKENL